MTEDEARKRWCPFARNRAIPCVDSEGNDVLIVASDDEGEPLGSNCIASDCMAWHWHRGVPAGGYCGLAGKPGA